MRNLYLKAKTVPTDAQELIEDSEVSAEKTWSSDKIVSIASGHIYQCSTAAATASKEITVTDMEISSNVTFEIFFANGNSADNMTVSINGETGKALKIWSGGSKKSVPKDIDAGVTLRVFDDGTDFIVLGNPVISSTSEYTVFADGRYGYIREIKTISSGADGVAWEVHKEGFVPVGIKQYNSTDDVRYIFLPMATLGYSVYVVCDRFLNRTAVANLQVEILYMSI